MAFFRLGAPSREKILAANQPTKKNESIDDSPYMHVCDFFFFAFWDTLLLQDLVGVYSVPSLSLFFCYSTYKIL